MKIALVSPYDFAYPGGVAHHISFLEKQFTRMGHDVKVIAPASKAVSGFGDRFIPIGRPRPIPSSGSICRITISLSLGSTIKRVLERENFDIIHLHEPFMPMLCSAVLRFSKTANVGTFHACEGRPGYGFGRPITTIMLRRRNRKLARKIAVSVPAMKFASKYIPGYYNIIPNGIDLKLFSPDVPLIDRFADGKLNILFVGRLEKRKGLGYLLRAYEVVKREVPNSRLIVVGPGTRLRRKYEKEVERSGLRDVAFIGYVKTEELPSYYKTADVFCAPALGHESFGIVLLEAMAVGTPVVASSIAGYASVLSHGDEGLLVAPRDVKSLAQALLTLLKDRQLCRQMGLKGIAKAKNYDWENIAGRVLSYYVRILGESPWNKKFPELESTPDLVSS